MLTYNFTRIMVARGVQKPTAFLKQHGFSHMVAHKIAYNKTDKLSLRHMEILCKLFNCTPNDFIDWVPSQGEDKPNMALTKLKAEYKDVNALNFIKNLSLDQISELAKILGQKKG